MAAVVLSWDGKFWHIFPPGSDIFPSGDVFFWEAGLGQGLWEEGYACLLLFSPPHQNLGIDSALSLWGCYWLPLFYIGRGDFGISSPLGQLFFSGDLFLGSRPWSGDVGPGSTSGTRDIGVC